MLRVNGEDLLEVLARVLVASLIQRRRMSHNCGVLASGKLKVVPKPAFPPH